MLRHKWKDNECTKCGIIREMRPKKTKVAIVGNTDSYKYETRYLYIAGLKEGWIRPQCWRTTYDD